MLVVSIVSRRRPVRINAALLSSAAHITGAGAVTWQGAGALNDGVSVIAGTGVTKSTGSGALAAQASHIVGVGFGGSAIGGTGVLADASSTIAGTGTSKSTGTGALVDGASTVTGTGSAASTYTSWNPSDKDAGISLSNSNLTATATTSSDQGVRGISNKTSGKYYFEIAFTTIAGGDTGGGIANGSATLANLGNVASGGFIAFRSGNCYYNGGAQFNIGSLSGGTHKLCLAVDLDNKKIWARVDNGNWNGSGSANPATNTGGQDITAIAGSGVYPAMCTGANGDVGTANFGASAFSQSVPSGFTSGWTT